MRGHGHDSAPVTSIRDWEVRMSRPEPSYASLHSLGNELRRIAWSFRHGLTARNSALAETTSENSQHAVSDHYE